MKQLFINILSGVVSSLIAAFLLKKWPAFPTGYWWVAGCVGFGIVGFAVSSFFTREKSDINRENAGSKGPQTTIISSIKSNNLTANGITISDNAEGDMKVATDIEANGDVDFENINIKRSGN